MFETTPDGVDAGRAGKFELVVAVDRNGDASGLRARGADLVVTDLGALLERQLAPGAVSLSGRDTVPRTGALRA